MESRANLEHEEYAAGCTIIRTMKVAINRGEPERRRSRGSTSTPGLAEMRSRERRDRSMKKSVLFQEGWRIARTNPARHADVTKKEEARR